MLVSSTPRGWERIVSEEPLPRASAIRPIARCVIVTGRLLAQRRIHLPRRNVGKVLHFADGTTARVYRETVVERDAATDACVLVVEFRLRLVRGWGHAVFRWESLLNTPLFVGFPGYVSKLWVAHDQNGVYRGLYEWDGAPLAAAYARALWRVLELVCVRGSIHYKILPRLSRDQLLADPQVPNTELPVGSGEWWRLVRVG
jgi:hypothetical protein